MKLFYALVLGLFAALPARGEVDIQSVTSPGGLNAWLVEEHSIPFVALEIRFRGGASLDAPGKRGATYLMSGLLDEGAGDLDSRAFRRASESLATSFGFDADQEQFSISTRFLTENRDASVALLRTAIHDPSFSADAIERVRGQILSIIQSDLKDPNDIAGATFSRIAYGDHPYGSSMKGTVESVTGLTREDLVAAHRAVLVRDQIYVGAVGDITPEQLGALMDEVLGPLAQTGAPIPPRAELSIPGGVTVVDFPTPQSVTTFGHSGLSLSDPDYFAANVLNHVLGGGSFESRLMSEVREKRGLTYGVYSYLFSRDLADVYMGTVSSANDRIAETVDVIRDEWRKLATDGITPEELQNAKTYITGAYPLRFDGNVPIANILVGMQMINLPIDYIARRNEKVDAVTLEDVKRVAGYLLQPDNLHFVVVGQPEGLETTTGQ